MTPGGFGGGIPINFERRKTSKDRLKVDWDYPKSIEIVEQDGPTVVQARMYTLPLPEALAKLAADDGRPLLIVRECNRCKGDDAFLSRTLDNEKTLLLCRWFHCVKLKNHVIDEGHTFHSLFAGEKPAHLVLATADGSRVMPLPGTQSQTELWETMSAVLGDAYDRDAERAVKEMVKLMSHYDHLDSMEDMYREQIDIEIEKRGPQSPKLKALRAKLARLAEQKEEAARKEAEICDLGLRPTEKPAEPTAK